MRTNIGTLRHFLYLTIRDKDTIRQWGKIQPYLQSSYRCKSSIIRTFYCRPDISDKTKFLSMINLTNKTSSLGLSSLLCCQQPSHASFAHNSGRKEGGEVSSFNSHCKKSGLVQNCWPATLPLTRLQVTLFFLKSGISVLPHFLEQNEQKNGLKENKWDLPTNIVDF